MVYVGQSVALPANDMLWVAGCCRVRIADGAGRLAYRLAAAEHVAAGNDVNQLEDQPACLLVAVEYVAAGIRIAGNAAVVHATEDFVALRE